MRFAFLLALAACHPSPSPSPTTDVEAEIKAAAKAFDDSQLRHDRAALERFLAEDMVFVRGSGKLSGRADFLATFANPAVELEPYVIEHPIFVRLGERSGLVGGETVMRGKENGTPFAEHFRYADVFAWRDGRWQVVYVQVTMLPPI
ncbi:MAG TPA: nuclear transport factor 2 family protein [Kofleriaceae bacterium]|nr:nuclear transport factor 2 family protein [Kofleriaceae bacterium]